MTSITQTIPNYVNGISEQPDELKTPGQLKVAKNVLPDVTQGLTKRPGGKLIGGDLGAHTTTSKWFHYYRDENEQYIGQINQAGTVKMWDCATGAEKTVTNNLPTTTTYCTYARTSAGLVSVNWRPTGTNYAGALAEHPFKVGDVINADFITGGANDGTYEIVADNHDGDKKVFKFYDGGSSVISGALHVQIKQNYLHNVSDADLQTLTLNDYTYINNRTKTVAMLTDTANKAPAEKAQAFVELKKVAYASQYSLNLFDKESSLQSNGTYYTETPVETVTRISVERVKDSRCACRDAPNEGQSGAYTNYPGGGQSSVYSVFRSNVQGTGTEGGDLSPAKTFSYNTQCDQSLGVVKGTNGAAMSGEDSLLPNVATKIFRITGNEPYKEQGDDVYPLKEDGTITGTATASGAQIKYKEFKNDNYTNSSDKKDLYFRLTTTGQSVSQKVSNSADVEYQARYQTTWDLLHGGQGWGVGDEIFVWMKLALYKIRVEETSKSTVNANRGLIRPTPTSFDAKTTVTAENILGSIKTEIDNFANSNFNTSTNGDTNVTIGGSYVSGVKQIGNGLYISRNSGIFHITTPVSELLNVLTDSVNDVAELPNQCKHGYVVKVANSEAEEDDYYVEFIGNDGSDGEGVWEECPKPGSEIKYDPATMPIQIVRGADGNFTIKQNTWDEALVGDTVADGGTNPRASFVGKTINKMLFFRNRLVMLSDENVIMSKPGDFFNFWAKSAITYTATDMIDISCSSEYPAVVYDGLQVNSGLVLFTKNQQFMLTTDSDVLSPLTAKINSLSSYNFNYKTNPVSLGTTIAFLDNAGKYNRFWEMAAVLREGEPNVLEQSKSISKSFDGDLSMIANSRENQVIFFGKKGTKKLYGFRYHTTSAQRIQQAWFNWELSGEIQHIAMLDDALFAIIKDGTKYTMQRFSIRGLAGTIYVTDDQGTTDTDDDISYRVHLDNSLVITNSQLGYSSSTTRTGFTLPASYNASSSNKLAVFCHTAGDNNGKYAEATIVGTGSNANIEFPGNWIGQDITVGYLYDMELQFPKIYVQQQSGEQFKSDLHSSLVIHRIKFSFGPQGLYTTTLTRLGKPSYTQTHESPQLDTYTTDDVAVNPVSVHTVPVYEKNTNLTLNLKSTHPTPATLYSMTWEGDYTPKYYKSV